MAPDRLVLPGSGLEAGYLSPSPFFQLLRKELSHGPGMPVLEPGEARILENVVTFGSLTKQTAREHTGQNSRSAQAQGDRRGRAALQGRELNSTASKVVFWNLWITFLAVGERKGVRRMPASPEFTQVQAPLASDQMTSEILISGPSFLSLQT